MSDYQDSKFYPEALKVCPWRETDHLGERRDNVCVWCEGYVAGAEQGHEVQVALEAQLERAKKIEEAAKGADLYCQDEFNRKCNITCLDIKTDFEEEHPGLTYGDELCDHCALAAALTPDPAPKEASDG